MKKIWALLFLVTLLSGAMGQTYCEPKVLELAKSYADPNAIFLKDFQVQLDEMKEDEIPAAEYHMVLKEGIKYQFTIANSVNYEGRAIFKLYDDVKLIGTNYGNGNAFPSFEFVCQQTKEYYFQISFIDGKEGCSVCVIWYISN